MNAKKFATLGLALLLPMAAWAEPEEQAAGYRDLEAQAMAAALTQKDLVKAEGLFAQAVDAANRTLGAAHPDLGRLLFLHALVLDLNKKPGEAEPLYRRAVAILEAPALASPTDLATALELYAAHVFNQGRTAEAEPLRERARPIRVRQVRELVAALRQAPTGEAATPISKAMTAPVLQKKVEPKYADVAKLAKYQSSVLLKIEIAADGTVQAIELLRGAGLGLDEKAAEAILQWKFQPGAVNGKNVAVKSNIEVNFRLM